MSAVDESSGAFKYKVSVILGLEFALRVFGKFNLEQDFQVLKSELETIADQIARDADPLTTISEEQFLTILSDFITLVTDPEIGIQFPSVYDVIE